MKVTKIFIFIITITQLSTALANDMVAYESRLNHLIENGVIDQYEAKKQMVQIKSQGQQKFHRQVRGIASKIKELKVYQIKNEPLEIPSN